MHVIGCPSLYSLQGGGSVSDSHESVSKKRMKMHVYLFLCL